MIDELAAATGKNPLEYRLALLKDARAKKVVERVAQLADWGRKREGPRARHSVQQVRPAAGRILDDRDGCRDFG